MSKAKVVGIVVALVALLGGGLLLAQMSSDDKSTDSNSSADTSMDMSKDASDSSSADTSSSASEATATSTVDINNFAFSPANITVKVGTKVTWLNSDSTAHTVTETDGQTGPDSGSMANGATYSFTYTKAGTFKYHCNFHSNMTGTVTVTE